MKKLVVVLLFLTFISPIFAQPDPRYNESNIYYISVSVERVIPTGSGYIIQYRSGGTTISTVGIPMEWFTRSAGRAEIITLRRGPSWPTMSVFYRDGEFSHVRLYVHRSKGHQTWGFVSSTVDVSRFFTNTDTLTLEFH